MSLTIPNASQLAAAGRNIISYAAGAATMAAGFHLISQSDASSIGGALAQIGSGVTSIAGGVSTLVAIGSALWAVYNTSNTVRAKAVAAIPGTTIVTTPEIANATPEAKNIVSNTTVDVVKK